MDMSDMCGTLKLVPTLQQRAHGSCVSREQVVCVCVCG